MSFIKDKRGVSEEFTSLPALAIVMAGFAVFLSLMAGVYYSYNENAEMVDKYGIANFVLEEMTMDGSILGDMGVIMAGGIFNLPKFINLTSDDIADISNESGMTGINFSFKLEVKLKGNNFDNVIEKGTGGKNKNAIAASKEVPVYLNDAQVVPGTFTVIVW